jgi:hypothetical protein
LILNYCIGDGDAAQHVTEEIYLKRLCAGFGGMRTYFRWPAPECNGRVEVLHHAEGGRFRCRRCHGLVYECQYEDSTRRAARRANKPRTRLRYAAWQPFVLGPIVRPKGMWRRKFWRLQDAIDEADYVATAVCVMHLQALADKVCGSPSGSR